MGFNQIRNLAITASVSHSFKTENVSGTYRRAGLWRHLVSVGICARLIAARSRMSAFEDAFLAGLLHDFGIEIGGGLGEYAGKLWRIGLMGYGSRQANVLLVLAALEQLLAEQGHSFARGASVAAANAVYAAS